MLAEIFWPVLMLLALVALLFSGYPVAFVLAGVGIAFAVLADVPMIFLSMGVQRIYSGTLANWLQPLEDLDPDGDPVEEIRGYIRRKLELARDHPHESQLFANEILAGAPMLKPVLEGELKALVDEKAGVIGRWIGEGRLNPVEPRHLIFMIWATTQHYSDFAPQIEAVLGDRDDWFPDAMSTVETIFIEGLKPRP